MKINNMLVVGFIILALLFISAKRRTNVVLSPIAGAWTLIDGERVPLKRAMSQKGFKIIEMSSDGLVYRAPNGEEYNLGDSLDSEMEFFGFFGPPDAKTVRIDFLNTYANADIHIDSVGPYGGTSYRGLGQVEEQFEVGTRSVELKRDGKVLTRATINITKNHRIYKCLGKILNCSASI